MSSPRNAPLAAPSPAPTSADVAVVPIVPTTPANAVELAMIGAKYGMAIIAATLTIVFTLLLITISL
jgi:uncharacterized membrane protein